MIKPYMEEQPVEGYSAQIMPNRKGHLPELWVGYGASYWQRDGLLPHCEYGHFPEHLFRDRAPSQSEAELEYIRRNYKPFTIPVFLDTENTIGRAIHRGNYSVEWEQGDALTEAVQEYVDQGITEWGSVGAFVRSILPRLMMEDAMGVLSFIPKALPTMDVERDGELVSVIDPDGEIRPEINYSATAQVWGFEYDRWYLLRLNESSEVSYGMKTVPGILCILVDDEAVWTIRQTGKKTDWTFSIERWYEHGVGEPPCIHLGGVPVVVDGRLVFQSPFLAAKGHLDIALTNAQYLQATIVKTNYPQVVMVGDPCDFYDEVHGASCFDGKIVWDENGVRHSKQCPSCKGTGKMRRLGPFNELLINPKTSPDGISPSDGVNATNALSYVTPPEHAFSSNREWIDYNIEKARGILHLGVEAPMAGGEAQTATQAGLNNRAKDAFVKPIADRILRIEEFAVKVIGKQIAGPEWDGFTLRLPTQYDLRTEADRIAEIQAARTAGVPPAIIDEMEGDLIAARYTNDPWMAQAMEVVQLADRLARMSEQTIAAEAAAGRAQPWEVVLHYAALDLYRELDATDAAFMRAELWDKVRALQDKARERAATAAPAQTSPALSLLRNVVNA